MDYDSLMTHWLREYGEVFREKGRVLAVLRFSTHDLEVMELITRYLYTPARTDGGAPPLYSCSIYGIKDIVWRGMGPLSRAVLFQMVDELLAGPGGVYPIKPDKRKVVNEKAMQRRAVKALHQARQDAWQAQHQAELDEEQERVRRLSPEVLCSSEEPRQRRLRYVGPRLDLSEYELHLQEGEGLVNSRYYVHSD
jgi:hypothetical protein